MGKLVTINVSFNEPIRACDEPERRKSNQQDGRKGHKGKSKKSEGFSA